MAKKLSVKDLNSKSKNNILGVMSYKQFLEEYDQDHIRLFGIPHKFISLYRYVQLTYDEWMTLLSMWIPGEIPEDK